MAARVDIQVEELRYEIGIIRDELNLSLDESDTLLRRVEQRVMDAGDLLGHLGYITVRLLHAINEAQRRLYAAEGMDGIDEIVDIVGIERRSVELIRLHISFRGLSLSITEVRRIRLDDPAFVDQPALFIDIDVSRAQLRNGRLEYDESGVEVGRVLLSKAFECLDGPPEVPITVVRKSRRVFQDPTEVGKRTLVVFVLKILKIEAVVCCNLLFRRLLLGLCHRRSDEQKCGPEKGASQQVVDCLSECIHPTYSFLRVRD